MSNKLLALLATLLFSCGVYAEATNQQDQHQSKSPRIIALAPHIVESLFAIGAGQQIIATTEHADYPAAAKAIPRVGNYARLQIERIVQLQPDAIIAWKNGNPQDDLARLQKYQLNVIYADAVELEDLASTLITLGRITGKEQQAERLAQSYLHRLATLRSNYSEATPVVGFYEMWANPLRTVAQNAWLQKQLTVCGVSNPFAHLSQDYPLVSLEKVLVTHPQIVIQPRSGNGASAGKLNWAKWPHIPAYKNGFIFTPDADKTHRMTIRMLNELDTLCQQVDTARAFYFSKQAEL